MFILPKSERFEGKNVDLQRLADLIKNFGEANSFETRMVSDQTLPPSWFQIQALKTGKGRTIVGARRCLDVVIRGKPRDFEIVIGTGEWGKNIAASIITGTLTLGAGFIWAGVSAASYKRFEGKLWEYIKNQVNSLSNSAITQKIEQPSETLNFCTNCGAKIVPGNKFCGNCGQKLI